MAPKCEVNPIDEAVDSFCELACWVGFLEHRLVALHEGEPNALKGAIETATRVKRAADGLLSALYELEKQQMERGGAR